MFFAEDKHHLSLKCRTEPQTLFKYRANHKNHVKICEIRLTQERISSVAMEKILIKAQPPITMLIIYLSTWS